MLNSTKNVGSVEFGLNSVVSSVEFISWVSLGPLVFPEALSQAFVSGAQVMAKRAE